MCIDIELAAPAAIPLVSGLYGSAHRCVGAVRSQILKTQLEDHLLLKVSLIFQFKVFLAASSSFVALHDMTTHCLVLSCFVSGFSRRLSSLLLESQDYTWSFTRDWHNDSFGAAHSREEIRGASKNPPCKKQNKKTLQGL